LTRSEDSAVDVPAKDEITELLLQDGDADREVVDRLIFLVYEELRRIAHTRLRAEPTGHTLDTSALVHEAYLKLVDQTRATWRNRSHFLAVASTAMRRILVDHARKHHAAKRGGRRVRIPLDHARLAVEDRADLLLELDAALTRLEQVDERLRKVVECRFFGGMTQEETAEALGVTSRTVRSDWATAKGLLLIELAG
jgi:RNA polymerase sigma factor (TIGR02999 family)